MRSLLAIATLILLSASTIFSATTCNGKESWCRRPYNQASYVTANDAFATGAEGTRNISQHITLPAMLANGVRAFVLHAVKNGNSAVPHMCLVNCETFDGGVMATALTKVKEWLDGNKGEVVTFIIRNGGKFLPGELAQPFKDAKLDTMMFGGKSITDPWPTLGDMVNSGKRVVVFATEITTDASLPWMMSAYQYLWESPSQVTSTSDQFKCPKDKPTLTAIPVERSLYMMNHFVLDGRQDVVNGLFVIADERAATTVNTQASIEGGITQCMTLWGLRPNFISLNFVDQGDGQKVVSSMNDKKMGNTEVDGDTWAPSAGSRVALSGMLGVLGVLVSMVMV